MKRAKVQACVALGVLFAAGAIVAGCEGLLGLDQPTVVVDGGGSSDATSTTPSEAASPLLADGAGDAAIDVDAKSLSDSASPSDASHPSDADDGGIDEPSAACAQQGNPFFCDDFDSLPTVDAGWDFVYVSADAGSITYDTAAYTSPPRSAKVIDPVQTGSVQLGVNTGAFSGWVHAAFDLRVDVGSLNGIPQVCIGQYTASTMSINYVLDGTPSAYIQEYPSGTSLPVPLPPLGQWTRIVLVYDVVAGTRVYEDGALIASDATTAGVTDTAGHEIFGGAFINPPGSKALSLELDNVVVRLH